MKAIVKILKGGNAKATIAYLLDPNAKAKRELMPVKMLTGSDNLEQVGERVAMVFGEGISPETIDTRNQAEIVAQLEKKPSTHRRGGKLTRHVVISAEFEAGEELSGAEINERLSCAAEDFVDTYATGSKFFAVIHRDSSQPHVHIEIENYNHAVVAQGKEAIRVDWAPRELEEMQEMLWTEYLTTGKGSTKNAEQKLENDLATASRPLLGKKKDDQALGDAIVKSLKDLSLRGDQLMSAVSQLKGFVVRRFSKAGAMLKKPSVSYGKTVVRVNRVEKHLDAVETFDRAKEEEDSKRAAEEFLSDYREMIYTNEKDEGKYGIDKKRNVRVPIVNRFIETWFDVATKLKAAKPKLKKELTTYVDSLNSFEEDDRMYEIPELGPLYLKGLSIHAGLEKAPPKKRQAQQHKDNTLESEEEKVCGGCNKKKSLCVCGANNI